MTDWDAFAAELDSPEATPIGELGVAIWSAVAGDLAAWLIRPN